MKTIKVLLIIGTIFLFGPGCAKVGTNQTDRTTTTRAYHLNEQTGRTNRIIVTENRETTTRASGVAVVSSSSTFEGLDASQDGRNQGLKLDKSGQSANVDKMLDLFGGMARMGAAMYGIPTGGAAAAPSGGYSIATPPGMKWILVPKDDASQPTLEMEPSTR